MAVTDDKAETRTSPRSSRGRAVLAIAAGLVVLGAAVLVAVLASTAHGRGTPGASQALASAASRNPEVDPGTSLPRPAAPGSP